MQRESTIKFWDDFYVAQEQQEEQQQQQQQHQQGDATAAAEEPTISARAVSSSNSSSSSSKNLCKEWILQPSPALLQELAKRIIPTSIVVSKRCCKGVVACQEQQTEPSNEKSGPIVIRILEIGSGTSCLARELCRYLNNNNNNNNITRLDNDSDKAKWNINNRAVEFHVLATDVSHVCIEQNRKRDAQFLRSSLLQYQVLNVVQGAAAADGRSACAVEDEFKAGMFDVILDKGCLDTFLFRSRTRGSGPKRDYSPLVRTVLDNVHTWLATGQDVVRHDDADNENDNGIVSKRPEPHSSDDEHDSNESQHDTAALSGGGVYLILSPRSKLKCVRDYRGFASVERHLLEVTQLDHGDLENGSRHRTSSNDCNSSSSNKEGVYLYTCHKNPHYSPAAIAATRGGEINSNNAAATESFASAFSVKNADTMTMENTTTTCPKCQLSLVDFFKNKTRGNKIAWTRKFQGHIHHCKGV